MADAQKHVTFTVDGVPVTFPYEPYDIQREYVESVIRAANRGQNALLESPTGTGKTLSLLCSSLAWQQTTKSPNRMIYYTSRTHIQLNQAAKEMKKTAYAGTPSVVLGSRVHMCLNDEVKSQANGQDRSINRACHNAIAKNACAYYTNYEQKLEANMDLNKVHDIEDLHSFGRSSQCCPYYASRKLADTKAAVVFMPYNYLLDLSIQKTVKLRVNNSIVIFDEGHNIESAFKDSASGQFTQSCLITIQDSCEKLPAKLSDALNYELHGLNRFGYDPEKRRNASAIVDEFSTKKSSKKKDEEKEKKVNPIEELSALLTNDRLQQVNRCAISLGSCKDMMKSPKGEYEDTKCGIDSVYGRLDQAGINYRTSDTIIATLEAMASFWSIAGVMSPSLIAKYLGAVGNLQHFITLMFPRGFSTKEKFDKHVATLREFYAAYLVAEFDKQSVLARSNTLINWSMNLWCLHPAIGLRRVIDETCVEGPRSLIITSGTLAPMKHIEDELGVKFPIVKEFDHLIDPNQFKIMLVGDSPNGYSLQSTHKDTTRLRYPLELGESFLRLFRILPYGTLVFFPSYPLMDKVLKYWKSSRTLWDNMSKATTIFSECQNQAAFLDDMINFKRLIDGGKRAVFLGVFRGKLSEGTNLQANHCRSVMIVGLPFPSIKDPRIVETRSFHSRRGDSDGQVWYTGQMRRALGQAIGRVIRSKSDFGMLFLCDPRFSSYKYSLSKWITRFYPDHTETNYNEIINHVKDFFMSHEIDISAMCISELNAASQGAFEFDAAKTLKKPVKMINGLHNSNSLRLNGHLKTSNNIEQNPSQSNLLQSDKNRLLAQYRVDADTYKRAQEKRRPPPANAGGQDNKRLKNSSEKNDTLWANIDNGTSNQLPNVDGDRDVEIIEPAARAAAPTATEGVQPLAKPKKQSRNIFRKGPQESTRVAKKPDKDLKKPNKEDCYICFMSGDLCLTNCKCSRRVHKRCFSGLNNTSCAFCGEKLKIKELKEYIFGGPKNIS